MTYSTFGVIDVLWEQFLPLESARSAFEVADWVPDQADAVLSLRSLEDLSDCWFVPVVGPGDCFQPVYTESLCWVLALAFLIKWCHAKEDND